MRALDDSLWSLAFAGAERINGWDAALARDVATHFASFAEARIAPLDGVGDLQGCRLIEGRVHLPDGFADAYRRLAADGWQGLTAPEAFGGQALGPAVQALVSEVFSGSCHALQMIAGLAPGAIRLLTGFATPEQQARLIPPLASGAWLATMCLTEPDAGSDLSRIRTRAAEAPEGWRVSGEKIFISGGDQDASCGILHLVLARTGDGGTRGLSLFACPSVLPDGRRNTIRVARLEQKMGLHGSPTCHMLFENAVAELIGQPGQGLAAMFALMNHARLDVALQGVAHAARAHLVAEAHARERVQGRGADGAPARLDEHPDIRRMLAAMDSRTLAARALAHTALVALETGQKALAEFLTPMAKVAGSQAGMVVTDLAIQVLGGYGYLQEYRVEQAYRDARICAIYEGANGIQALTLANRGLQHAGGAQARDFARHIADLAARMDSDALTTAFANWQHLATLTREAPALQAHGFMQASIALADLAFWERVQRDADVPARLRPLARPAARQAAHEVATCLLMAPEAPGQQLSGTGCTAPAA